MLDIIKRSVLILASKEKREEERIISFIIKPGQLVVWMNLVYVD